MNRIMKNLLVVIMIAALTLSGSLTAFAADSNGIRVQYNGKYITNADNAKIIDGRVMVPFRQVFESMGADVTYDSKTKTIQAKTDDKEISFTAGSADITIVENGVSTVKKMDVKPFVDKKSAYVPVRFIAESMGFCVGWDAAEKAVVIIDPATLFADADQDFSVLAMLMKSGLDPEGAYASTGRFNMDITTYEEPGSILPGMGFTVTGTMSGVQQKSSADMVMTLAFQFDKMLSGLTAEEKTQMQPLLDMFKNTEMKIKMDGETGVTYMNSSLFSAMDPTVGANTWYKMNVYDTYAEMGVDLKSLAGMSSSDIKLSEILAASMSAMEYAETSTYQDIKTAYAFMNNLIGDSAFTKKTAGSYTTYSLNFNKTSVLAAMAKTALDTGLSKDAMDLTELSELLNSGSFDANIMIKEKAGLLQEYSLKGNCAVEEMSFSFDMKGDPKNTAGKMSIDQKDVIKMIIDVESRITETSNKPDVSIPKDAVVVDYPDIY